MSDEDTLGADPGPEPATEYVPTPPAPTPELAWSMADDTAEAMPGEDRRPLPRPLRVLLGLVAAGALGLAAFTVGDHYTPRAAPPPPPSASPTVTVTTTAPSPPVTGQPPVAPPPVAAPPSPSPSSAPRSGTDARFLDYVHTQGVPYRSGDADAIASAHDICRSLATRSLAQETGTVQRALGWSYEDSAAFVAGAVGYYCPQYAPPD